jgi:NAD(P)-dependent dehydrogenase (short-subunit alcohol dehydrogenase family)
MAAKTKKGETRRQAPQRRTKGRERPGREHAMREQPQYLRADYRGSAKLEDRTVLITGGDSGIGRAVCVAFAKEGADLAILYREEDKDARDTQELIEQAGRRCLLIEGDVGDPRVCSRAVDKVIAEFGKLDVLINNAAEQHPQKSLLDISKDQLLRTFETNIFGVFYLTQAALPYLRKRPGANIINTASVVAYRGNPQLLDYTATKGAIVAFTRALAKQLADEPEKIRVNAVAPGPIWTPLIPSTFDEKKVQKFGDNVPLGRPGEPWECAGAYVFLASMDANYITGQTIHVNGGEAVNG